MFKKAFKQVAAVFLDRDGVLNYDRGDYSWLPEHFKIIGDSMKAVKRLHDAGFPIVVITNQAGIAKGLYGADEMNYCHSLLQEACGHSIDDFYYSPYHPTVTESLSRKPEAILFERAMAKYNVVPGKSWMVGDKERDLVPAKKLGIQTIMMNGEHSEFADHYVTHLSEAAKIILDSQER